MKNKFDSLFWEYVLETCDNCRNRDNYGMLFNNSYMPNSLMLYASDNKVRVDWNKLIVKKDGKPLFNIHLRYGKKGILKPRKSDFELIA
ncbi:hypothetical protein [Absicoccus intestinalis]|uniref:Uncharacterized protein n=1 Tax=Absicoccus intestinalis TaxID=2926319 RepID=A0ABU4WLD1_9FIRM|nr:hypothetical protein [Absicoccus sp. CLA-KB-P134]MDX8417379.1 hypothetical protein [Absicoccus sp. CLA-KB-P134]